MSRTVRKSQTQKRKKREWVRLIKLVELVELVHFEVCVQGSVLVQL